MMKILEKSAEEMGQTVGYKLNNGLATIADEEEACKKPKWAYLFALYVKGADIKRCEEAACKEATWAYYFALYIKGADIEKCRKAVASDDDWAKAFARDIG